MNKRIKLIAVAIITICTLISFIYWNSREQSADISTSTEAPQPIEVALSPEPVQDSTLDSELESLLPPPLSDLELKTMMNRQSKIAAKEAKLLEIEMESTYETVQNIMYKESFVYLNPFFEYGYVEKIMEEPRMVKLHQLLSSGDEAIRKEVFDSIRTMCNVYLNDLPLYIEPGTFSNKPTVQLPGGAGAYALLLGEFDTENTTFPLLVSMHEYNLSVAKERDLHLYKDKQNGYTLSPVTHLFAEGERMMFDRMLKDNTLRSQLSPHQNEVLKEYEAFKILQEEAFQDRILKHYELFNIPLEERTQVNRSNLELGDQKIIFELATKFLDNIEE